MYLVNVSVNAVRDNYAVTHLEQNIAHQKDEITVLHIHFLVSDHGRLRHDILILRRAEPGARVVVAVGALESLALRGRGGLSIGRVHS